MIFTHIQDKYNDLHICILHACVSSYHFPISSYCPSRLKTIRYNQTSAFDQFRTTLIAQFRQNLPVEMSWVCSNQCKKLYRNYLQVRGDVNKTHQFHRQNIVVESTQQCRRMPIIQAHLDSFIPFCACLAQRTLHSSTRADDNLKATFKTNSRMFVVIFHI